MDYLVHQRRLFPLIAKSYALQFAQNELVAKVPRAADGRRPDPEEQRELESRAAGLKAANTWHATHAIRRRAKPAAAQAISPRTGSSR